MSVLAPRLKSIRKRAIARMKRPGPRSFHDYVGTREIAIVLHSLPSSKARLDFAAQVFAEATADIDAHHVLTPRHKARLLLRHAGQPLSTEPSEHAFLRMLQAGETAFQAIAMALKSSDCAEVLDRCAALLEGPCLAGLQVTMHKVTSDGFARFSAITGNISAGESWAYPQLVAAFADESLSPRCSAALKTWKRMHVAAIIKALGPTSAHRPEIVALRRAN